MIKAPPRIIVHSFDPEDRDPIERLLELAVKLDIPILLGQGEWFLTKAGHEPLRLKTKPMIVHPDDFFIHASTSSGATQAAKAMSFQEAELTLLHQLVTNLEAERDAQEVTIRQDRKENDELLREVDRLKALVPAWQHPLPVGSTVAFVNDAEKVPMTISEVDRRGRQYWLTNSKGVKHYAPWSDVEPVAEHTSKPDKLDVSFSASDVRIDGKPIPLHVDVKETPWKGNPLPTTPKQHPQDVGGYVRRTSSHTGTAPIGEIALVCGVLTNDDGDTEYVVTRPNGTEVWWFANNCEPCDPPTEAKVQDQPADKRQKIGGYVRRTVAFITTPIGTVAKVLDWLEDKQQYEVRYQDGRIGYWHVDKCEPCDPPADAEAKDPPNDPPLDLIDRAPEPST